LVFPSGILECASGSSHTLALHEDGTFYIWGNGGFGQLGMGTTRSTRVPTRLELPEGVHPFSFGGGQNHSFILSRDGTLFLWGDKANGQLGGERDIEDGSVREPREYKGEKWRLPRREEAWRVAQWMFLGREDTESNFFVFPVEILFHFVTVVA
jgi:alpha-tubulin suppressor-like RCC1 family protein